MNSVPRREKTRTGFKSPDGLALLAKATGSAKKDNDARATDPWTSGGAKANQYREPMPSVTVVSPKKKDENNGN
jgi:hypothetical protein